jgi:hypothetical protein
VSAFEAKRKRNLFDFPKTYFYCVWRTYIYLTKNASMWKAALSCFPQTYKWCIQWRVSLSTERSQWSSTPLWTWTVVYDSGRTGSDPKVNALNQVRHSKKIKLNFLFLIVFYWWRSICRIWSQSQFCFWLYFTWCCCALKKSRKL